MEDPTEQNPTGGEVISPPAPCDATPQARAPWLQSINDGYNSHAVRSFLLYGNISDIFPIEGKDKSLKDYLTVICGKRDIIIVADPASGIDLEVTNEFSEEGKDLLIPSETAHTVMERVHQFLTYIANLKTHQNVTLYITNANYLFGEKNDVKNGLLLKRWTEDPHFTKKGFLIFMVADSLKNLQETVTNNNRIQKVEVPFPNKEEVLKYLHTLKPIYPDGLKEMDSPQTQEEMAEAMAGTSLHALQALIKRSNYSKKPIQFKELEEIKKRLVEEEGQGMITFLTPKNTLADLAGEHSRAIQTQFEDDINLWNEGKDDIIPNGYLIVGPSGVGKTFFLRCLAGSTGVPVMQINNFRGQYQGETEGNLEHIFRLAKGMSRVYLAIDEADQTLGNRSQSSTDGGVSGRVYSYFAQEMSNLDNRGKICWILLTSHPQNLEVDLKRPGRCDVRIPLLPCESPEAGTKLIAEIAKRAGLEVLAENLLPASELLTPGGATTIVESAIRLKTREKSNEKTDTEILNRFITAYQPPSPEKMWELTQQAIQESSSKEFIPEAWRTEE